MNPIKVEIFYWDKEECEMAIRLEKEINACSHIPKEVNIIRRRTAKTNKTNGDKR